MNYMAKKNSRSVKSSGFLDESILLGSFRYCVSITDLATT